MMDRRTFSKLVSAGLAASQFPSLLQGASKRTLKIGHTGLTWISFGGRPRTASSENPLAKLEYIEQAAKDISSLGFWGIEYFSQQVEAMEAKGGIGPFLRRYNLPLISAYCPVNLSDPEKRKTSVEDFTRWGKLVKKYGGTVLVIGPNQVQRDTYNFSENKANIVATLNDLGKAANDVGLTAVLHQHTGTCVETRDETYEVLHAMDTRYVKFGPDVGQLRKGGSDPVQVIKDFLPIVHHMHLKDYSGGEHYLGYCPLGEGKVNIPAILDMMEGRKIAGHVMVELDGSPGQPLPAGETAKIARRYLENLGAPFRAVRS
jgi:inosose dehydratase